MSSGSPLSEAAKEKMRAERRMGEIHFRAERAMSKRKR